MRERLVFQATDNCLTEADVVEAARAAFAEVLAENQPTEEYLLEAAADLAAGAREVPMWQSCGGFAESVLQGMEERLALLIRERRGEAGFSQVVREVRRELVEEVA